MRGTIHWGVVGSGGIARRRTIPEGIVPASGAQLTAVYDSNQRVNAEVAELFSTRAAASLEELLRTDLDAVYVATPVHLHCEQVLQCIQAGKHVLCEKPLAMSVAEARGLIALAKQCEVQLGTALMMRFQAQQREALEIIKAGRLGRLVYGRAQLSCWYPPIVGAWRQSPEQGGGGALMDLGVHCIDLLEMFFGPVASVSCTTGNLVHHYRSEDSAVATLVFDSGAIATVDTFFCIADEGCDNRLEIYGTLGSIVAQGTIGQGSMGRMVLRAQTHSTGYAAQQNRDAARGVEVHPPPVNPYRAEIEEFTQSLLTGHESELSAAARLHSQQVLEACYESARTGRTVAVS